MDITVLVLLILVPLVVWRIYSRLQRLIHRTQSQLWRHRAAAFGLPLLLLLIAFSTRNNMLGLSSLGGGVLAGAWLGVWGIKLTRFENTPQGFFYTPNRRLGIAVFMLLIARVIYRLLEVYLNSRAPMPVPLPDHQFAQDPLTMVPTGLLLAYYSAYGWGLLRWRRTQKPLPAPIDPLDALGIDKY